MIGQRRNQEEERLGHSIESWSRGKYKRTDGRIRRGLQRAGEDSGWILSGKPTGALEDSEMFC